MARRSKDFKCSRSRSYFKAHSVLYATHLRRHSAKMECEPDATMTIPLIDFCACLLYCLCCLLITLLCGSLYKLSFFMRKTRILDLPEYGGPHKNAPKCREEDVARARERVEHPAHFVIFQDLNDRFRRVYYNSIPPVMRVCLCAESLFICAESSVIS